MLKMVNKVLIVKIVTKNKEITYMSLDVYCIYSLGLGPWGQVQFSIHIPLAMYI